MTVPVEAADPDELHPLFCLDCAAEGVTRIATWEYAGDDPLAPEHDAWCDEHLPDDAVEVGS